MGELLQFWAGDAELIHREVLEVELEGRGGIGDDLVTFFGIEEFRVAKFGVLVALALAHQWKSGIGLVRNVEIEVKLLVECPRSLNQLL